MGMETLRLHLVQAKQNGLLLNRLRKKLPASGPVLLLR